jgi:hypothetical protein
MLGHAGAYHVHIHVHDTTMQVRIGFNGGGVVAILPECALAGFSAVVLLCGAPGSDLHASGSRVAAAVLHEQIDMVRRDHVVQYAQAKAFARFIQLSHESASVARELQQGLSAVTAMGDVPDEIGQEMTVGMWHRAWFC